MLRALARGPLVRSGLSLRLMASAAASSEAPRASSARKAIICPSMLSSDFANLASEAARMVDAGADWLHMDVMDGYERRCAHRLPRGLADGRGAGTPRALEMRTRRLPRRRLPRRLFPARRHFVPNLTLGAPIVKSLRKHTTAFLDCHLMVTDPAAWVADFAAAGANQFTFHIEATGTGREGRGGGAQRRWREGG